MTGSFPPVKWSEEAVVRAVVLIVSVTTCEVVPGVTVADGENEAAAPAGSPETEKVMGLEKVPFEGTTVRLKTAGWPAVTVAEEVGVVTV